MRATGVRRLWGSRRAGVSSTGGLAAPPGSSGASSSCSSSPAGLSAGVAGSEATSQGVRSGRPSWLHLTEWGRPRDDFSGAPSGDSISSGEAASEGATPARKSRRASSEVPALPGPRPARPGAPRRVSTLPTLERCSSMAAKSSLAPSAMQTVKSQPALSAKKPYVPRPSGIRTSWHTMVRGCSSRNRTQA